MPLKLRQEEIRDHKNVFEVIKEAFEKIEKSDQSEHFLVDRLRKSEAFIPELSIVAEQEGMIVGHILLTQFPYYQNFKGKE